MSQVAICMPKPKIKGAGKYAAPPMEPEEFLRLRDASNELHRIGRHDQYYILARALDEIARLRPEIE